MVIKRSLLVQYSFFYITYIQSFSECLILNDQVCLFTCELEGLGTYQAGLMLTVSKDVDVSYYFSHGIHLSLAIIIHLLQYSVILFCISSISHINPIKFQFIYMHILSGFQQNISFLFRCNSNTVCCTLQSPVSNIYPTQIIVIVC